MHSSSRLLCPALTASPPLPAWLFPPLHPPGQAQRSLLLLYMSNLDKNEWTESQATSIDEMEGYNYFVVDKDLSKGELIGDQMGNIWLIY
jgi:hypothetical protein